MVYKNNLHTLQELQTAITQKIEQVTPATIHRVFNNMQRRRVQTCLQAGGSFSVSCSDHCTTMQIQISNSNFKLEILGPPILLRSNISGTLYIYVLAR